MPADPVDIARAIRPARVESWSDAAVKARYPNARDGLAEPADGWFDAAADAAAAIAQRAALFGRERRRFTASADGLHWFDPAAGVPIVRLIDPEQAVDGHFVAVRIEIDLDEESTSFELFG